VVKGPSEESDGKVDGYRDTYRPLHLDEEALYSRAKLDFRKVIEYAVVDNEVDHGTNDSVVLLFLSSRMLPCLPPVDCCL
jgi:hypothetical protein